MVDGKPVKPEHFEADTHMLTFLDPARIAGYGTDDPKGLLPFIMAEHARQHYGLGRPLDSMRVEYAPGVLAEIHAILDSQIARRTD